MTIPSILLPLFVQVALTFALLFILGSGRVPLVSSGKVRGEDVTFDDRGYPERLRLVSNSLKNQFELPVLFYVLTILAMATRKTDLAFVLMEWVFVLSRIAHAYVHVTSPSLARRGLTYAVGGAILAIMWTVFAVRILLWLE